MISRWRNTRVDWLARLSQSGFTTEESIRISRAALVTVLTTPTFFLPFILALFAPSLFIAAIGKYLLSYYPVLFMRKIIEITLAALAVNIICTSLVTLSWARKYRAMFEGVLEKRIQEKL